MWAKGKRRERRSTRAIEGAPPMDTPQDPPPMPPAKIIVYAITLPLSLLLLIFWPAGSLGWRPGWLFVAIVVIGFGVSGLDRKSVVSGKSVSVRVDLGGGRNIKKNKQKRQ